MGCSQAPNIAKNAAVKCDNVKTLIGGTPVIGEFREVVMIQTDTSLCSATIVGPKTLLTAGHCGETGDTLWFFLDKTKIEGSFQKSTDLELDLGLLVLETSIPKNKIGKYATIYSDPISKGEKIWATGFGCTGIDKGGAGVLRKGSTYISDFDSENFVFSGQPTLCFGDSGSSVFLYGQPDDYLIGVNSKSNIKDKSISVRMDSDKSKAFLKNMSTSLSLGICGVNLKCNQTQPTQVDNCPT